MTTLDTYINEGRLIRKQWTGTDAQGRETACLLAALSPEVAKSYDPDKCPAHIMPQWLARLTPWIDDAGTEQHWPAVIRRYANLASRWHVLTPAQWSMLDYRCRAIAVREARQHTTADPKVLAAIDGVLVLLDRASIGEPVSFDEWRRAAGAAAKAADAAARAADAAARAADAAARAADAAARAADVAARAAEAAARAADAADAAAKAAAARSRRAFRAQQEARAVLAGAEGAAAKAADAAARAAAEAASDRMIDAMLDAIEAEIVKSETN